MNTYPVFTASENPNNMSDFFVLSPLPARDPHVGIDCVWAVVLFQVFGQVSVAVVHLPALRADELDDVGRVGGDLGGRPRLLRLPRPLIPRSPEPAPELRG